MYQQCISFEDFQNVCRFCLSLSSATTILNPLYDETNLTLTKTLCDMIVACLGIKVCKQMQCISTHNYNDCNQKKKNF